jgi:hypothetical protein
MSKIAQALSIVVALIFASGALFNIFNPIDAAAARGFEPIGEHGMTNVRLLAAPLLMVAVAAIAAAIKKNPVFLGPAVLYLMFGIVLQVTGLIVDGPDGGTIRALITTVVMLIFAEIPVQLFNRAKKAAV